jgi:hypothetical protein
MRTLLAALLLSLVPLATAGCKSLECGEGTIDRDGICVAGDETPGNAACGPFTELGPSGTCEPILDPTVCDDSTTEPVIDPETGVTTCVGTGAASCDSPMTGCTASANTMTVCGRLYDLEDDSLIGAGSEDTSACPPGGEATGPCSLIVRAYNAVQFALMPGTAVPLTSSELVLDHCGRFRIKDIAPAGAPFIGIGVIPHPSQGSTNRVTGVAFQTQAGPTGGVLNNLVAYTTRASTDSAWAASLGMGPSLAPDGVYVNIFRDNGTTADPFAGNLAAGVQILETGSPIPDNDYYFSDDDDNRTTLDDGLTETGVNGTGIVLDAGKELLQYSGTDGPLPGGCDWSTSNGKTVTGVFFVQIHTPQGTDCSF